eukprot:5415802-Pleurochrysis_carterae.AAC.1
MAAREGVSGCLHDAPEVARFELRVEAQRVFGGVCVAVGREGVVDDTWQPVWLARDKSFGLGHDSARDVRRVRPRVGRQRLGRRRGVDKGVVAAKPEREGEGAAAGRGKGAMRVGGREGKEEAARESGGERERERGARLWLKNEET